MAPETALRNRLARTSQNLLIFNKLSLESSVHPFRVAQKGNERLLPKADAVVSPMVAEPSGTAMTAQVAGRWRWSQP